MMFGYLYQSALMEFFRLRRTLIWLFVAMFVGFTAFAATNLFGNVGQRDVYSQMSILMVYRLLPLVAAIFAGAVISQEVAQKTIVYLVTRPIRRQTLVLARTAAAATVVFVLITVCAVVLSAAVFGPGEALNKALFGDLVALAFGTCAYVALFVLLSLWVNKSMLLCLLFAFGWETLVADMPGDLYHLSIYSYMVALGAKPTPQGGASPLSVLTGQAGVNTLSFTTSWFVLVCIAAVSAFAGAWWFASFEYVPREDTD